MTLPAIVLAGFLWSGDAIGQTPPPTPYEVGDTVWITALCDPTGNGVVLSAFIEGGPELANTALSEQAEAGKCQAFDGHLILVQLAAITYIGFYHKHHLWALRFGKKGFQIMYMGPYESAVPSPDANGKHRRLGPAEREA